MKRLVLSCLLLAGGASPASIAAPAQAPNLRAEQLFQTTNLWPVHLVFSKGAWDTMEPKGGGPGFMPMFGGGPPPGGPGGPPRMPGDFGAGMFLAPAFLKAGDSDGDRRVSEKEMRALAERWFKAWDTNGAGSLDQDKVRAGLNASAAPTVVGLGGAPGGGGRSFLQAPEGKRNGLSSLMGVEFEYVRADLEFGDTAYRDVAVRYKGNGTFMESRGSLKRSLKLDLNKFVRGQELAGKSKLNLHNNVTDASLMKEVLSLRLFRDAGVPSPRTAYARVWVTVPDKHDRQYFGLYSLVENVDADFAADRFGTRKGALFKPSTPQPFTDLGDDWSAYQQPYDPKTELTQGQKRRLLQFCRLVSHAADQEFEQALDSFLDLDEFARFMAVTVYLSSMDSILGVGQNYYVFLDPRTQKLQFIPWDQDHSFGSFPLGGGHATTLDIDHPWMGDIRFLERVFKVPAFKTPYRKHLADFSQTLFKPERIAAQVNELAAILRPAVAEESTSKAERFDQAVGSDPASGGGGFGMFTFMNPINPIKSFAGPRNQSVLDQLAGTSHGSAAGGLLFGGGFPGGGGNPMGPGPLGIGMLAGSQLLKALDQDKDGSLNPSEFQQGLLQWLGRWAKDPATGLTEDELRTGLNKEFPMPPPGGPFAFPGGPPPP